MTPLENPYAAAQRFLEQNDISTNYIDEVVRFIEKNTSGVSLGDDSTYVDPFTGQFTNSQRRT
jgi:phospholipase A-2-activating protein